MGTQNIGDVISSLTLEGCRRQQGSADRGGNFVNTALIKAFAVHSGVRAMLRAVRINLTNTPRFAEPNGLLGTPEFADIASTLNNGPAFHCGITVGW
jgi:hypothetical protein